MTNKLLSNEVPNKTLPFCLAYLANLTIKSQGDMETFFMPFIDKSFSDVIPKWMTNLHYFESTKLLSREDELERSRQWVVYLLPRFIPIGG